MSNLQNPSKKGSILIVDDNPTNLELLSGILSEQGYKVRLIPDGQLALMSVQSTRPDLILLDILMPEMDGYQVCQSDRTWRKNFIGIRDGCSDFTRVKRLQGLGIILSAIQLPSFFARLSYILTR